MTKTAKYYELIVWTFWIILGIVSIDLLLWFAVIPAILAFHGEGIVNAFCHGTAGYANYDNGDRSRNVPILGFIFWGNGWHNNHHRKPSSFDFGKSVSGNKREFDPCRLILPLIKK
jgi:stearoyl-CoA desaturase (delta-9 desaturase)